jgi:hypothetical protein
MSSTCAHLHKITWDLHKIVPNDSINYLLHRDWKCNDEQVMMIFYEIVNAH